ncbi:hypothetical protein DPMN_024475 [Dreissena polymorpha]|uniref:Uncharacterized protein n=1 Tax=Dreissena polymorpha TaxID=45954 RepID=A0A9D4LPU9_DREPO|nr:hypothetical protein DPMN_024475 [Dreissena polymorpha]
MLSRLGHCESYDFSLELETSLARAINDSTTTLTPLIVTGEGNQVFHVEWDNLNKITTNVHGPNVVNRTAGIMVQEVKPGFVATHSDRTLNVYERSKARSLKADGNQSLPPLTIPQRCGPRFPKGAVFTPRSENYESYLKGLA